MNYILFFSQPINYVLVYIAEYIQSFFNFIIFSDIYTILVKLFTLVYISYKHFVLQLILVIPTLRLFSTRKQVPLSSVYIRFYSGHVLFDCDQYCCYGETLQPEYRFCNNL